MMNEKIAYISPVVSVIQLESRDVITTSKDNDYNVNNETFWG